MTLAAKKLVECSTVIPQWLWKAHLPMSLRIFQQLTESNSFYGISTTTPTPISTSEWAESQNPSAELTDSSVHLRLDEQVVKATGAENNTNVETLEHEGMDQSHQAHLTDDSNCNTTSYQLQLEPDHSDGELKTLVGNSIKRLLGCDEDLISFSTSWRQASEQEGLPSRGQQSRSTKSCRRKFKPRLSQYNPIVQPN